MQQIKKYFAKNLSLIIIYFCTILTLSSLYAAQPIQPLFQQEFNLSQLQAILFTSLMMLPLGFAPLVYGYFLENFCTKQMIKIGVLSLGIMEILFACSGNYLVLLTIRALQGLIIPAILTGLMSYISITSKHENIQHAIALYIGATITGGFLGRFLSGFFSDLFGWRFFFFVLGGLLILAFFLLKYLDADGRLDLNKPKLSQITGILSDKRYLYIYIIVFCVFFVFAAILNLLPFELKAQNPDLSETEIGLMYLGYIMGVIVSLFNRKILKLFKHESSIIMLGLIIFILGTIGFSIVNYLIMFAFMFVFCTGMFTVHIILSGYLNKLSQQNKSLANGLYLSFYYTGGAIGSFAPSIVYQLWGWHILIASLVAVLLFALFMTWKMKTTG